MKVPMIVAAALTLVASAPLAQAFQTVQSNGVPSANAPRVADPDDIRENMATPGSVNGSAVMPFGLRLGTSPDFGGFGGRLDEASPFLQNPPSRTVLSPRQ